MKKVISLLSLSILMLGSCQDFDYGDIPTPIDEEALNNAALVLGIKVDATHDWSTIQKGTVTIMADADLDDIAKVQILTESPFYNPNASLLAEAAVSKGEAVTLDYDVPRIYTRLIAACVSSQGQYYIKGFDVGTSDVSFTKATRSALRKSSAFDNLNLAKVKVEYRYSTPSYNAQRTIIANNAAASDDAGLKKWVNDNHINLWENKNWENERLWGGRTNGKDAIGNGWNFANNTVVREVGDIDPEEAATLNDLFAGYMTEKDNMASIRESEQIRLNKNHLISTGAAPITITPVLITSSEIANSHLYYYYYNPADIPNGMSEEDYLKTLPKFKAIHCYYTMTSAGIGRGSQNFFKKHEYLLPYYGDADIYANKPISSVGLYTTDGKLYRIRNGQKDNGADHYATFQPTNSYNKMVTKYDDNAANIENQLWQVFTDKDGFKALYNVGAKQFLVWDGDWDTKWSAELREVNSSRYYFDTTNHIWRYDNKEKQGLGSDLGIAGDKNKYSIFTDKNTSIGDRFCWFFEEYTGNDVVAQNAVKFNQHVESSTAKGLIIPEGYRIGFMLRKQKGNQEMRSPKDNQIKANANGCCYGNGQMNTEINQFPGHFGNANTKYSLQIDDPRIAMFEANGKAYLTFEDGSDCNFCDMVIELNGGVEPLPDIPDIFGQVYTFCFEDRAKGDYDLNDVVIKAVRTDATHITYSVEACSGTDKVYLRNIHGKILNENTELHELFGVKGAVNGGTSRVDPIMETIEVDPTFSFYDLDKVLYVYNATTDTEIRLSETGEDPHAIMIPSDFQYPLEGICVKDAYPAFLNWAKDRTQSLNWYIDPAVSSHVYKQSAFHFK